MKLYLASQSPRRRELLAQLGYQFDCLVTNVDETRQPGESAGDYVTRLAEEKASAGLAALQSGADSDMLVLGADTIVVVDEQVLEKPEDQQDAARMMQLLSGRSHQVMTAIALASSKGCVSQKVETRVSFRDLTDDEILAYWQTGEPADKAGGYGIQGIAGKFVSRIDGSYSAVVGLPLMETDQLIRAQNSS